MGSMEKILVPLDRALSEIGRFVLSRPKLSGLGMLFAFTVVFFGNTWVKMPAPSAQVKQTVLEPAPLAQVEALTLPDISETPVEIFSQTNSEAEDIEISHHLPEAQTKISPVAQIAPSVMDYTSSSVPNIKKNANKPALTAADDWQVIKVRSGDYLAKIFKRNGLKSQDLVKLAALPSAKALRHLKPGQEIRYQTDSKGYLKQLTLIEDEETRKGLLITAHQKSFKVTPTLVVATSNHHEAKSSSRSSSETVPVESTIHESPTSNKKSSLAQKNSDGLTYVTGEIKHSLYKDAQKAGLTTKQARQLSSIFNVKGLADRLKSGDSFSVLYENGSKNPGVILAAQIIHSGKSHQLIRFVAPNGKADYYTPQGESLSPGLSRAPLNYDRLSSTFTHRRLDPVYRRIVQPHLGVDYSAPQGTPVKAAGDGVIIAANYRVGYGNTVVIRHNQQYSTLYAHLARFAALRTGVSVKQGQIIGYVGHTGHATGNHLHYEIRVNDIPANPLTVALPGKSIPAVYRARFLVQAKMMLAQLKAKQRSIQLAQRHNGSKKS